MVTTDEVLDSSAGSATRGTRIATVGPLSRTSIPTTNPLKMVIARFLERSKEQIWGENGPHTPRLRVLILRLRKHNELS